MNMTRYTTKLGLSLLLAVSVGACDGLTDLTELNENPNGPLTVPAAVVFTQGVQSSTGNLLGTGLNLDYGELLSQHMAEIQYAEEDVYLYRDNVTDGRFRAFYAGFLKDFTRTIALAQAEEAPNVEAAARIMKTWAFQSMTDIWGDLPYSEALQGEGEDGTIQPAYDAQQAIYDQMFSDLELAASMIDPSVNSLGAQDLIYDGDPAAWERFANSLRLRLAMRLSEVDAATAQTQFNAALAGPIFESEADNALQCYGGSDENPWFLSYQGRPGDRRVSATLIDTLKSYDDPRVSIFAQPIESDSVEGQPVPTPFYRGMPNGLEEHSYSLSETSWPGDYFVSPAACWPLMTYEEVLFLRAEAAARGWTAGNAVSLYNQAIRASMERWDTPEAEIVAYLAQPEVVFNPATWREQIALQKWLALFGQGLEAFAEVRRLNWPQLTPGPDAVIDELPDRYPYPFSEQTFNDENLEAALSRQGTDGGQLGTVWWDVDDGQ
ncbi:MAG: SusD/RagB family nutrient-binding outer membrane lipoprotein [Longimicrobiales bacterium]